jgi:hypothetical protein
MKNNNATKRVVVAKKTEAKPSGLKVKTHVRAGGGDGEPTSNRLSANHNLPIKR